VQTRPNVVFEIGWFYGRLGRGRVCILFKEGTRIHSDLDGVVRVQFTTSVEEKIVEIEAELLAVGLLKQ
jgi:predicted nucleotide-binding protein